MSRLIQELRLRLLLKRMDLAVKDLERMRVTLRQLMSQDQSQSLTESKVLLMHQRAAILRRKTVGHKARGKVVRVNHAVLPTPVFAKTTAT